MARRKAGAGLNTRVEAVVLAALAAGCVLETGRGKHTRKLRCPNGVVVPISTSTDPKIDRLVRANLRQQGVQV